MEDIKKILFITLSNIGDVILTLPVLDYLRENFAQSKITVMVGPRPKEIFQNNPYIDRLIIYDKHSRLKDKINLFNELKKERFDMVIDLRNSLFGALLPAKFKTSPFLHIRAHIRHMKDRHLYKIQKLKVKSQKFLNGARKSLFISPKNEEDVQKILKENNIKEEDGIVIISASAKSRIKRWPKEKFPELISLLIKEFKVKVILVGDKNDIPINKYITENSSYPLMDLSAKTTIGSLAYLLKKARLLIANDSAVLHIAGYLNIPTVAIFGPTDETKYGPWPEKHAIVKKDIFCRPCQKAQCKLGTLKCMSAIKTEDVLRAVREVLTPDSRLLPPEYNFQRILIVRTDRIGDVLLSTPVIKALRDAYPCSYIAMMIGPYAKEIIEGNPYLDEAIIYDKDIRHKSWLSSIKFSLALRKKSFDLCIVLHPTNRAHIITLFAGIPKRIGYDRKLGFLLTDRIKYTKQLGQKHELEYNLDLVRYLGIQPQDKNLFMPIKPESEAWAQKLLKQEGIGESDRLLAVHPGASCISRIWPAERYAEVIQKLAEKYGFKTLILSGTQTLDLKAVDAVLKYLRIPVINLAGKTSLSQAASLLKRCSLLISTDTGPMHIATAVGTPQVVIFGRNQPGLSPLRWGPTSKKHRVLHKELGCIECLAHNCIKDFACLKAISVEEVLSVTESILKD
jgi:lipopolysaccharide heptosyltransferase II